MPEFDPRRADPGERFGYTTRANEQREIAADADGVVRPETAEDVAILDGFDLPVARKVLAEEKKAKAGDSAADDGGQA